MLKSSPGKVLGVPQNSMGNIFYQAKLKIWIVPFKPMLVSMLGIHKNSLSVCPSQPSLCFQIQVRYTTRSIIVYY